MEHNVPLRAGRREWIGLAVLALPVLLFALDFSVLYVALPHLSAGLGASGVQQLWITDIYGFMVSSLLVTMGTLGDRIGRRKLLLIGAALFGAASAGAAFSTSPEMLIAMRALLGIAGSTLMPSTLSLINNMFRDPKQRGVAIAVFVSCFTGGTAIGPIIGGVLLENFWWGSVFLMGVPIMVLLLIAGPILLPEFRDPTAGRLDLVSVALSLAAILPFVYGFKGLAVEGWSPWYLVCVVAGLAVGWVFVRRQRRLAEPLLDLKLFGSSAFRTSAIGLTLNGMIMAGTALLINLYFQLVVGLSPLQAGLWLIPGSVAIVAGSMATPLLVKRIRPAFVIAGGLVAGAAGYLLLTLAGGGGDLAVVVAGNILIGFGTGPITALGNGLIMGSAKPEKAGSASAIAQTTGDLGIALGIGVIGSLATAVYRASIVDSLPPGTPAVAAGSARESLEGAVTAATQLPGAAGDGLLSAARDAFADGLHAGAVVAAAVAAGIAALAVAKLRHIPSSAEETAPPAAAPDGVETGAASEANRR